MFSNTGSKNTLIMSSLYVGIVVLLYYIYYELGLASNDPLAFTKNLMSNIFFIIIPVIILFTLVSVIAFSSTIAMYVVGGGILAATIIGSVFYFLQSSLSKYIFNQYLLYFVIVSLIIIGISIFVTLFSSTLRKMEGWTGFFINLLVYIPCLIRDGIHGIIREYQSFSNTLIILFAIEIALLMMYFFLVPFINNKIFPSNLQLLENPVMLNTGKALQIPTDLSNNFALSMWFYVNPGSVNKPGYAIESPIFTYLDGSDEQLIRLTYSNIDQGNNDFIMYIGEKSFPISLPLQKWNNIVFNCTTYQEVVPGLTPSSTTSSTITKPWYKIWFPFLFPPPNSSTPNPSISIQKTTIDMFVNGILERSVTFDDPETCPLFTKNGSMTIGHIIPLNSTISTAADGVEGTTSHNSNQEGLYGAICNIVYYQQPLTQMALVYNFNLLTIRNPPI
jgi:hypothetical protein